MDEYSALLDTCFDGSQDVFKQIFLQARQGIAIYQHGKIKFCNPYFCTMCGYSAQEIVNMDFLDLVHDDFKDLARQYHERQKAGEEIPGYYEIKGLRKNRDAVWLHVSSATISWKGEPADLKLYIDITAKKESERRLTETLEATRDGIWEFNLRTKEFHYSDQWASMLGYTQGEVPNLQCFCEGNIHPEDRPRFTQCFNDYLSGKTPAYQLEFRLRTKGGSYKWIYTRGMIVERDAKGSPVRMVGAHTDINEVKQAELLLKESNERFYSIIEHMDSGVAVYEVQENGTKFIFREFNPKAEQITNLLRQNVLGKNIFDLFPNMENFPLADGLRRVWTTGVTEEIPPFYYSDAQRQGWRENTVYKLPSGEVVAIFYDVTERVQSRLALIAAKDVAEAATRAKSEFLANMSHEIRTPLNGISGMMQLLQTTVLDAEQARYVDMAQTSCLRLTNLLSDILDLSRIEADKLELAYAELNLHEVAQSVLELLEVTYSNSPVALRYTLDPTLVSGVCGDELRIRQILFNLLGNAFKFTQQGVVSLEIYPIARSAQGKKRVVFAVHDTGPGIVADKISTIFSSFTQIESDYTRSHQGAGLGLTIVRRLVGLMSGDIIVDSEPGEGTSVYVVLPLMSV